MSNVIQFDWRQHWKERVEPHLGLPLVRSSVEVGMKLYDPAWTWEDGPHAIGRGRCSGQRVVRGKLSWYQPWGRCHWISFFACAIGALNYPELDWHFVSGPCHTVPVGSRDGEPRVVMDILSYKSLTAEEAIALARRIPLDKPEADVGMLAGAFASYIEEMVPRLRAMAFGGRQEKVG